MNATVEKDLKELIGTGRIDRVATKYRVGEQPSEVTQWSRLDANERLMAMIELRARHLRWRYGVEPGLERVLAIARRA
jgi:hypothetical protein